jgi:hypothetical protein
LHDTDDTDAIHTHTHNIFAVTRAIDNTDIFFIDTLVASDATTATVLTDVTIAINNIHIFFATDSYFPSNATNTIDATVPTIVATDTTTVPSHATHRIVVTVAIID